MPIIEIQDLEKRYPARRGARTLIGRGGLSDYLRGRKNESFHALKGITLSIEPGESIGIIGANGSGKSTLLKIIAGVTAPSKGHVVVEGRVASLLELGAGFHPMLTGRENVYLNAALLGLRRKTVDTLFDAIVDFAELAEFIDQPVDTYSSGMFVRLAFSVAIHCDPDIFLVDEVLAVGDEAFQRKCRQRIGELREAGKTILFVSHDLGLVNALCDRVFLLDHGALIERGAPRATIDYYLRRVGAESSVHTMAAGPLEAIFSNGRIALFHDQTELSPPGGWTLEASSLGAWHGAGNAAWVVTQREPHRCVARGQAPRLPITWEWEITLEDDTIAWRIACHCERPAELAVIRADLQLIPAYTRWLYGDLEDDFPETTPDDTARTHIAASEEAVRMTGALPPPDAPIPPLLIEVSEAKLPLRLEWANADYISAGRILEVAAVIPPDLRPLPEGVTEFATIRCQTAQSTEAVRHAALQDRTVASGPIRARFQRGALALWYDGQPVTHMLHCWASIHARHLWQDSQTLRWDAPEQDGATLRITGASRRLPIRQVWEIAPADHGVALRIWLEVAEPIRILEHHFSIMLPSSYDRWESGPERGNFPPIAPDQHDWVHLNSNFAPGERLTALSPARPSVSLWASPANGPVRMTPINSAYDVHGRVLQALRVADAPDGMAIEAGRYDFFEGGIDLSPVE